MTQPTSKISYAVITPARNEAGNLERLAESLKEQSVSPRSWLIVDTGSSDGTPDLALALAEEHRWIRLLSSNQPYERGGPIVRAFQDGVAALDQEVDVIVKIDADISFDPSYFERILQRFSDDPALGIASGTCLELEGEQWTPRFVTGDHVWGACRAYRSACLADVSPLEERMGWDGIDAFKAKALNWRTASFDDIEFFHHRAEGARDGRWNSWVARGRAAHYMGYRPTFMIVRSLNRIRKDPAAVGLISGWAGAALRREPRCEDATARAVLRRQQRARELPRRALESLGLRSRRVGFPERK